METRDVDSTAADEEEEEERSQDKNAGKGVRTLKRRRINCDGSFLR